MPPQYKFVEVSPVSEATLEAAVNEWVGRGWQLEAIRFVIAEGAQRPQLAYVSFVTHAAPPETGPAPPPGPRPEPRPIEPPEQPARVITAPGGDEVE